MTSTGGYGSRLVFMRISRWHGWLGDFEENDEAGWDLLARHKRVKEKSWKMFPDLLEPCSYRANQIDLVGLVREHPAIHVIPAVLGGHGMDTRKAFDIFCE